MKRSVLTLVLLLGGVCAPALAPANADTFAAALVQLVPRQTVYSKQTAVAPFGSKVSNLSCNVDRWTGWVAVDSQRSVAFDVDYVRGAGAATAVTMRCETSRSSTTPNDSGRDLHVIVSTDAAGVSTTITSTWSTAVSADASWTWTVTNIPAPFINCLFRCTAANASDRMTAFERGIVP